MSDIIDADKMNKIIYYANEAKKFYQESVRQKQISQDFLHKACKLILNNEEIKSKNEFKKITNDLLFISKEEQYESL